jgi:choline dehydrogenase-like flavoprotein
MSSGDGSATSWSPAAGDPGATNTSTPVSRSRYLCNPLRYKRATHRVMVLMIVDGRTVTRDDVLRFDVCVIGAGPAGMLVARHLAGKGVRVALLERGDDDSGHRRTRTARIGGLEYDVGDSRRFGLGGTASKWVLRTPWGDRLARFRELGEDDFALRDWVPYSGWPFGKSELRPFYDLAWSSLGWPGLHGGPDAICSHGTGTNPFQDPDGIIQQRLFVLASPSFTERLIADLAGSASATVLTNSTVVDIRCDTSASHVSSVRVATQRRSGFSVEARVFILAAGGIENPRMLLASRSRHRDGLGNGHGLVGRFFMEHPLFVSGVLHPKDVGVFDDPTSFDPHLHDDIVVRMDYVLHEDVVRRERLLRSYFVFEHSFLNARTRRIYASESAARSLRAAANVRAALMGRAKASNIVEEIRRAAMGPHHLARFGLELTGEKVLRRLNPHHRGPGVFRILAMAEQVPDPNSRVRLIHAKDEFGVPMARLDWRLTNQDVDSYARSQDQLAERLVAGGYESIDSLVKRNSLPPALLGAHHHMGTTRMSDDRRRGVVDRNSLVHGIDNLYVTGTSVFPTGGYANPTLTAMALALRVARHCESAVVS